MRTLCFATNNRHKLAEIQAVLGDKFKLVTLQEAGCFEELPETHETIAENSMEKATYVWDHYRIDNFADDTGLIIPALSGAPGVHSAHYAGPERNPQENIRLVLEQLGSTENRSAYFLTVITLIINGTPKQFEGKVHGRILAEKRGTNGFGYDPVFVPEGYSRTFAEMTMAEKAALSHRSRAFALLTGFLTR